MILSSFTGHISDEKFKKRGKKSQSWLKKKIPYASSLPNLRIRKKPKPVFAKKQSISSILERI